MSEGDRFIGMISCPLCGQLHSPDLTDCQAPKPSVLPAIESKTVWRHRNGAVYVVIAIANLPDTEDYPKTVLYMNVVNGTAWARRFDDWHRSFTFIHKDGL